MRHYEIMRYAFEITDESANKIIREQVFNNLNQKVTNLNILQDFIWMFIV